MRTKRVAGLAGGIGPGLPADGILAATGTGGAAGAANSGDGIWPVEGGNGPANRGLTPVREAGPPYHDRSAASALTPPATLLILQTIPDRRHAPQRACRSLFRTRAGHFCPVRAGVDIFMIDSGCE